MINYSNLNNEGIQEKNINTRNHCRSQQKDVHAPWQY